MGVDLTPDRRLTTDVGRDDRGRLVTLWRTEFWLRGEMVDATPLTPHPRQAIRDGDEATRVRPELPDYLPEYRKAQRTFTAA